MYWMPRRILSIYFVPGSVQKPFACINSFNPHKTLWGKGSYPPFYKWQKLRERGSPPLSLIIVKAGIWTLQPISRARSELCWPPWVMELDSDQASRCQVLHVEVHSQVWLISSVPVCVPAHSTHTLAFPTLNFPFMSSFFCQCLWKPLFL